ARRGFPPGGYSGGLPKWPKGQIVKSDGRGCLAALGAERSGRQACEVVTADATLTGFGAPGVNIPAKGWRTRDQEQHRGPKRNVDRTAETIVGPIREPNDMPSRRAEG